METTMFQSEMNDLRRTLKALKLHPRICRRIMLVAKHWPALPQAGAMPERLPRTIADFCARDGNRDGRGLSVAAREAVERTLKHIRSAERKAADGATRKALAHRARSFLKSLRHNSDFDRTIEQASRFAGDVQKTGKRNARAAAVCEPEEHVCGTLRGVGEIRLRRVVSVKELMSVGGMLNLCVAHGDEIGRQYHAELRKHETEFWTLGTSARAIALLSVEGNEGARCITEFQGLDGEQPCALREDGRSRGLPGWMLRRALRRLDADASDQPYFTGCGTFRSLLASSARNKCADVVADGRQYRVWRFPGEMIIAARRVSAKGRPARTQQWSRFVRRELRSRRRIQGARPGKRYEWCEGAWHDGAMDVGRLLGLVERSRDMYEVFVGCD